MGDEQAGPMKLAFLAVLLGLAIGEVMLWVRRGRP
jgi:hypothetical protein